MEASEIVCITCGQQVGEVPRLNRLPSGTVCPSCRNRVLEALPSLLSRLRHPEVDFLGVESQGELDFAGESLEDGGFDDDPPLGA